MQHHVSQSVAASPKADRSRHGHHQEARHRAQAHKTTAPVSHSRHIHNREPEKHNHLDDEEDENDIHHQHRQKSRQ